MKRRPGAALLVVAGVLALGSCDGGPTAGDLVLHLTTPNQNDGAIAFTITTDEALELASLAAACTGCQAFTDRVSATELRAIVLGDLAAGPIARVTVSDVGKPSRYAVQIREVAGSNFALRAASGYTLVPRAP